VAILKGGDKLKKQQCKEHFLLAITVYDTWDLHATVCDKNRC